MVKSIGTLAYNSTSRTHLTYQHVLPALVPARVAVEVLGEARLYVCTFVLRQNPTPTLVSVKHDPGWTFKLSRKFLV